MVRSLIIRQVFLWVDILLAVTLAVVAWFVTSEVLDPVSGAVLESNATQEAETLLASLPPETIGTRGEYNPITTNGLFGDAGRYDPNAAPPPQVEPAPPGPDEQETELNLRLAGTTALASPDDPFAGALIENKDDAQVGIRSYVNGEEVMENVRLIEVYRRAVTLMNERLSPPRRERLSMDEDKLNDLTPVGAMASAPGATGRWKSEQVPLNKQELVQELYTNYSELTKIEAKMYRDAAGNVIGVTADNISDVPLAQKLGLTDGDVLQTVNNETIDSEEKILELVQKYQNANSFRISILRDGKPKVITYTLE